MNFSIVGHHRKWMRRLIQKSVHSYLLHAFVSSVPSAAVVSISINAAEYEETTDFWTMSLSLSQRPSHRTGNATPSATKLLWLSESHRQQLEANVKILRAWCWTIFVLITLLCLVLFDIALPHLTVNIEGDGRTYTQLKAQNIGISAPELDYKHVLSWFWESAPTVDLMLCYDVVVKSSGIKIACKGVQCVHKVDLSQLLRRLQNRKGDNVRSDETDATESGERITMDHSAPYQLYKPMVIAVAAQLRDVDIRLDPTLISASLYILAKDVLLALCRAGKDDGNNTESTSRACNSHIASVLINMRRFALTVQNIVPSEGYELVLQSCVYKRQPGTQFASSGHGHAMKSTKVEQRDEIGVEHSFCLSELTLHSCTTISSLRSKDNCAEHTPGKLYDTDTYAEEPLGQDFVPSAGSGSYGRSQLKELLLQVNGVTGYCIPSATSNSLQPVHDMRLNLEYLYVRPAAPNQECNGRCNGRNADDTIVNKQRPDAAVSAALIVYGKFTSLFARAY